MVKYPFTEEAFWRWLASTKKSAARKECRYCVIAVFLGDTGQKEPFTDGERYGAWSSEQSRPLPKWARRVAQLFDNNGPDSQVVPARQMRAELMPLKGVK
jgi:hypothetical protein